MRNNIQLKQCQMKVLQQSNNLAYDITSIDQEREDIPSQTETQKDQQVIDVNDLAFPEQDQQTVDQVSEKDKKSYQQRRRSTFLDKWKPYDQRKVIFGFSFLKHFHSVWITIFNKRIKVINGYPVQFGDFFFFLGFWALFLFQFFSFTEKPDCSNQVLTIIFGCRNGIINFLFGVSLERAILWHKFLGWSSILLSINLWVHSHYSFSGILLEAPMIGLVVFSLPLIRRKAWEFFIKVHWILIIVVLVACILHDVPLGWAGFGFFIIDLLFRFYFACKYKKIASEFYLEKCGLDLIKVTIPTKRKIFYKGGQYFFIMIPKISCLQWHPFSACSAPYQENLIFYVKALGDWTRCFYQLAGEQGKPIKVKGYLDGPYGNITIPVDCEKYQHFMFISGGVGITPIISSAKEIAYEKIKGRPLKNLSFIWTTKEEIMAYTMVKKKDLHEHLINQEESIVKTFYHVTSQQQANQEDIEYLSQSQIIDMLSGRPNIQSYFEDMHKCIKKDNQKYVGVLVCGPASLISSVEYLAEKYSKEGIRFDVHQEIFEF